MPKDSAKPKRKAAVKAGKAPPRSTKSKKDPNAPKRPLSAYMLFSQDWREKIKQDNREASFGEIGKLLGAQWKLLEPEERQPYLDRAAEEKAKAEKLKQESEKTKKSAKSASEDDQEEDDD